MSEPRPRLDKWLWCARFYKSRTLAADACASGRIRVNGTAVAKAHHGLKEGDVLTFPLGRQIRVVRVLAFACRRGPFSEARRLYENLSLPGEDGVPKPAPLATFPPEGRPGADDRPGRSGGHSTVCAGCPERSAPSAGPGAFGTFRNPSPLGIERAPITVLPNDMFDRLFALLDGPPDRNPAEPRGVPQWSEIQKAAAVLLAIAARLDGDSDAEEQRTVARLLEARLGVPDGRRLLDEADREAADSTDFYGVTRVLKDRLDEDGRIAIVEMLWEVACADGEVHDYEASLVRRVAGLMHVTDRDAGEARRRVLKRTSE